MKEIERIVDQLDRAWRGPAWHGPSVQESLEGVDAAVASRRSIAGGHTIWELAEHIAAWEEIVRTRIEGNAVTPTDEMDWPPVRESSAEAWQRTRDRMASNHDRLRAVFAAFPDGRLDEVRPGADTWYVLLHGIVQHDLYHAGQIGLLRKADR
jgi:uncharacterized damage-inducible protein DinB